MTRRDQTNALARALRRFFAEHMPRARGLSPHTVLSHRDAFALSLGSSRRAALGTWSISTSATSIQAA